MKAELSSAEWERYARQLALPDINPAQQIALKQTRILMVGAGGLGAAALPYLAGAGIGHIVIADHDVIDRTNLQRQTIYEDVQAGQSKAEAASTYIKALNPHIETTIISEKVNAENAAQLAEGCTLILDGSDNFETKTLLNHISIKTKTPLISASVNQFDGQCGIFAGYGAQAPCYHCLFPSLPTDARNCNEAGILGTAAGLAGMFQAHMTLCYLLGIGPVKIGSILSMDFRNLRIQHLQLGKDPSCTHCKDGNHIIEDKGTQHIMTELISMEELQKREHVIVDVRTAEEIEADPIERALHMEISTLPSHYKELPEDVLLAFVCAANVRSVQAADFMTAMGHDNICVLDKFSF